MLRSATFLRIGAVIIILCGFGHLAGYRSFADAPPADEAQRQLFTAMRGYVIPDVGRTTKDLTDGFSIAFTLFTLAAGWTALLAAQAGYASVRRGLTAMLSMVHIAESAIGIKYWFIAPNSFIFLATALFIAAWFLTGKELRSHA